MGGDIFMVHFDGKLDERRFRCFVLLVNLLKKSLHGVVDHRIDPTWWTC